MVLFISVKLVHSEKFFVLIHDKKNFENAAKFCETKYFEGTLPIITNEEKIEAINKTIYDYGKGR